MSVAKSGPGRASGLRSTPSGDEDWGVELTSGDAGRLILVKVRRMARRLGLTPDDREQWTQQLRLEVYRRAIQYDPARGTWGQFISTVVNHGLADLSVQHRRTRPSISLDADATPLGQFLRHDRLRWHRGLYERPQVAEFESRHDWEIIENRLPPEEQFLLSLLREASLREAARRLNIPLTTLIDRIRRIERQLVESGFSERRPRKRRNPPSCGGS